MESASWQRPLYGFEISQNQAKMPLKSGFSDGLGVILFLLKMLRVSTLSLFATIREFIRLIIIKDLSLLMVEDIVIYLQGGY